MEPTSGPSATRSDAAMRTTTTNHHPPPPLLRLTAAAARPRLATAAERGEPLNGRARAAQPPALRRVATE